MSDSTKRKAGNVERVSAAFIHSMRILIKDCTGKCDGEPLEASVIVRDGDWLYAVPFCQHLGTSCHVSHRCGVPAVHLVDHREKVIFEKLGKKWVQKEMQVLANTTPNWPRNGLRFLQIS